MSLTLIEQVREHLCGIANEPDHKVRRAAYGPDAKAMALALLRELEAHAPSEKADGRWCAACTIERGDGGSYEAVAVELAECPARRRILDALAPLLLSAAARASQAPGRLPAALTEPLTIRWGESVQACGETRIVGVPVTLPDGSQGVMELSVEDAAVLGDMLEHIWDGPEGDDLDGTAPARAVPPAETVTDILGETGGCYG